MPSLLELFLDPVSIAFFLLFGVLWAIEALFPARQLPEVAGHRARSVLTLLAYFLISSYLPFLVTPWLAPLQVLDLASFGAVGGGLGALLAYQVVGYAYHRALHRFGFLFRSVHQMHHSAERLDVPSAFWFSPLDMAGWTLVATIALAIVGVTPEAVVVFVLSGTFLSTFQHANLRTPRWLGYLIQRPESHSYHHARGVHASNYADLPVLDLIFGTFVNPADFAPATGYYDGASKRVGEMLLLRDVTRAPANQPSAGAGAAQRVSAPISRRSVGDRAPQSSETPAVLSGR